MSETATIEHATPKLSAARILDAALEALLDRVADSGLPPFEILEGAFRTLIARGLVEPLPVRYRLTASGVAELARLKRGAP